MSAYFFKSLCNYPRFYHAEYNTPWFAADIQSRIGVPVYQDYDQQQKPEIRS